MRPLFAGERVRVYGSLDVVGVELGGALKNIFAIAAGADYCGGGGKDELESTFIARQRRKMVKKQEEGEERRKRKYF